jgi:hypothetical protein
VIFGEGVTVMILQAEWLQGDRLLVQHGADLAQLFRRYLLAVDWLLPAYRL